MSDELGHQEIDELVGAAVGTNENGSVLIMFINMSAEQRRSPLHHVVCGRVLVAGRQVLPRGAYVVQASPKVHSRP